MKVRWLGNAGIEIFGDKHIYIDPNFKVEPEREADIVLLTHEHDDHFAPDDYKRWAEDADLYAPETSLKNFDVKGKSVVPGDEIGEIKVLNSDCWGSEESVSYFYRGLLHSGDSNIFPEAEGVELIFTACFPDYYDDYVSAFKRLEPDLVIPFHYDPEEDMDDAEGLVSLMDEENIPNRILEHGESIEI